MFENLLCKGGLSLDRLNNFCRIAEAGGITKAAGGDPGKQSLYAKFSPIAALKFSSFLLKAFVSRVRRRQCMRSV